MSAIARRRLPMIAAGLAIGVAIYELVPRDETRISRLLSEACSQVNQVHDAASLQRLRHFLRAALRPGVEVHLAEFEQELQGEAAVSARAEQLLSGAPLSVALSSSQIHLSGRLARVDADLVVTVRGSGEQRRDLRPTRIRLVKVGEAWQIEAIDIEAVAPSEPEARP